MVDTGGNIIQKYPVIGLITKIKNYVRLSKNYPKCSIVSTATHRRFHHERNMSLQFS